VCAPEKRLRDRPAKDTAAKRGGRDILSVEDFKKAVRARTKNECAATESDFQQIPSHAKSNDMLLRGQEQAQKRCLPKDRARIRATASW
jgi:hypothetical protein